MSRGRLALAGVALVGGLATWLVTRELGPWRPLVSLLDGDHEPGAPLSAHHELAVALPAGISEAATRARATEIDTRVRGTATVLEVAERTITLATLDASAEARATLEGILTRGRARFEVVRILDESPVIDALRRFARELDDPGLVAEEPSIAHADAEAPLRALVARAASECAACRPGADEALLVERDVYRAMDGGSATERWTLHLISRAPPALDERHVSGAELSYDEMNRVIVMIGLTTEGEARMAELSGAWLDRRVAMIIDGEIHMAPVIRGVIARGPIQLQLGSGRSAQEDFVVARDLVLRLRPGIALPEGTTFMWRERPGVEPSTALVARVLTVGSGALLALLVALGLARLLRLEPAPASLGPRAAVRLRGDPLVRLVVTLALALVPWALGQVPLPFLAYELLDPQAVTMTLATLGLMPILLAHLLVSLVVALVPRLRTLRGGGLEARRRLAPIIALVALGLAALQALPITLWLGQLDPELLTVTPGIVVLVLTAGSFAMWGAAALVTRFGIGNGFVVLLLAAAIEALVGWHEHGSALVLGIALALATAVLAATSFRVRGDADTTRRMPLAGLVPLDLTTTLFQVVGLVAALVGTSAPPLLERWPLVVAVVVVGLALAWLLARPLTAGAFARPAIASVLLLVALVVTQGALVGRAPELELSYFVMLVSLPVMLADFGGELGYSLRAGPLARLASVHDVNEADRIASALADADIPVALRGVRMRSLLRFMGPWLPVEVLVPAARIEAARRAFDAHTHADVLRPFDG